MVVGELELVDVVVVVDGVLVLVLVVVDEVALVDEVVELDGAVVGELVPVESPDDEVVERAVVDDEVVGEPNGNVVSVLAVVGGAGVVAPVEPPRRELRLTTLSVRTSPSPSGAGPMLPRPSRSAGTPISRSKPSSSGAGDGAGGRLGDWAGEGPDPTLTALRASGAATAAAVNVDNDRASKNRPRPVDSPGRCRYIRVRTEEGWLSRIVISTFV